jgi:hypothetical protein
VNPGRRKSLQHNSRSLSREGNHGVTTLETRPNGAAVAAKAGVRPHLVEDPAGPASSVPVDDPPSSSRRQWLRTRFRLIFKLRTTRPSAPHTADQSDAMRTLDLVRRSRQAAVRLTVGIATVSFVLSFTSLRELAAMSAWHGWSSWLWPLIIDGVIILATLGIVSFAPYPGQFWNKLFLWVVLISAALVSVGGNAFHAWLATGELVSWMRWGSAGLACVPPVALLVTTHILAILWRFNPTPPPDPTSQLRERALELAVEGMQKWEASAAKFHEMGHCRNLETSKLAHILRYLYESRPRLSNRKIGEKPEVNLHHDHVGKVKELAPVVLGVAVPD